MKFTITLSVFAAAAIASPAPNPSNPKVLFRRTDGPNRVCQNNCGRSINSGFRGPAVAAQRSADCNSFLAVTSTRPAATVHETHTLPSYAIPTCTNVAEYVDACACVGATASVVYVDAPVVTIVDYVYKAQ
ncbi:hypothetical protein AK830_g3650 [Neonectria ditissima]|uniref:Uncharacterized protein n=1 Tax=Neonectria ditissima TaxID=78410 RepID=A0A0P7BR35_9HYPO|nr:hypothetical protein AK830_g3650 [Neonectria ditissima]